MSPGYEVYYTQHGAKLPVKGGQNVDIFLQAAHPSVSRVSTDASSSKIRIAYQTINTAGMQEACIIDAEVKNPSQPPIVTPVTIIQARAPKFSSVMYFTFIDPDYVDMPAGVRSNVSVLYWLEASKVGVPRRYAARYCVFDDDHYSSPAYLSVDGGNPRHWTERADLGDYMSGGFFWKKYTLNYFAQWVEPTGIMANIVTLPFKPHFAAKK
jgi:hypothetical protein